MEGCASEVRALFWEACHLPRLQSLWMSKQGITCPIKGAGDGSVPFCFAQDPGFWCKAWGVESSGVERLERLERQGLRRPGWHHPPLRIYCCRWGSTGDW